MSRKLGAERAHSRAYLAVVWTDADSVESVSLDGNLVTEFPCDVPIDSDIFVTTETLVIGTRVLGHTALSASVPIRLVEHDRMITLEIYNYFGPEKTFWELANPGAFFQGFPYCAFYMEVAERDSQLSTERFMTEFPSGVPAIDIQESPGLGNTNQRKLNARYSRLDQTLGVEIDLVTGELIRRFTERGDMDLPKLTSEVARHSDVSPIKIGDSSLEFRSGDAWLLALPDQDLWVAGIQGDTPTDVTLTTERGQETFQGVTSGLIVRRGNDTETIFV
jgi:hypothetical protein